ncbi:hypothetical protein QTO34_011255 [Cnephaeus nilssonii]|uniref:Bcl-2 Bcl-2 homology region 1-3 domain-containing protein n=1 Tax=Cnephaeus nilssonii TaxID=3371016 RepID=A0AA40HDG0_CNENI|nr:hypothetical protein QTO34_011255 [Eptesicus nilssonii]
MFGLKRNAVIGLNLYCGGAKLGAGGGGGDDASPSGKGLLTAGKEAAARREAGGGEAGPVMGGSAGASPPATLAPDARRVARPSPIGAEGPDVTATPTRLLFAPVGRASLPEEMEAAAADAIMSPEEELDGYEPEPLGKRPAVLPLLELVGEAGPGPGAGGSLPSTPPPAEEEEEDELFRQSLEIISRYLREQATGAKDAKPMGGPAASSRKALETLRRVGDGVQRNHEMAFQVLRRLSSYFRNRNILAMSHCFRPLDSLGMALFKGRKGWDVSFPPGSPERCGARRATSPSVGGLRAAGRGRAPAQTKAAVRTRVLSFSQLDIKNEDDVKSLSRVMVHVFSDGVTNWGRIVTLISFGAFVAKHLKSINQESCIDPLAESITDVLVRTKRDWLVKQRGWDGFVEFFHVEDLEGGIRNVLLAFAGPAGSLSTWEPGSGPPPPPPPLVTICGAIGCSFLSPKSFQRASEVNNDLAGLAGVAQWLSFDA